MNDEVLIPCFKLKVFVFRVVASMGLLNVAVSCVVIGTTVWPLRGFVPVTAGRMVVDAPVVKLYLKLLARE